jgi:hypothetical protein
MDRNTLIAVLGVTALLVAAVVWLAYRFRGKRVALKVPLGGSVEVEGGRGVIITRGRAGRDLTASDASGGGVTITDGDAGRDLKGTTTR